MLMKRPMNRYLTNKLGFLFLTLVILIIIGLVSYLLFNPDVLFVNYLIKITHLDLEAYFRMYRVDNLFFRSYFSDILFTIISLNIALILKALNANQVYIYIVLSIPVLSEICQGFRLIYGTFDYVDLLIYLSTGIFFIILLNYHETF